MRKPCQSKVDDPLPMGKDFTGKVGVARIAPELCASDRQNLSGHVFPHGPGTQG